jgi:hypothetical protein
MELQSSKRKSHISLRLFLFCSIDGNSTIRIILLTTSFGQRFELSLIQMSRLGFQIV